MSWRASGKTKIANSGDNTGTGSVVNRQNGMGRGRVLRSLIALRAPGKCVQGFNCLDIRTYNTKTGSAGSKARITNRVKLTHAN